MFIIFLLVGARSVLIDCPAQPPEPGFASTASHGAQHKIYVYMITTLARFVRS
jgi:hypothetical protein